jgi:hypothetical protein
VSRPARLTLLAAGVLAFLVLSALLARWLSVENVERDAILDVLRAQARGDGPGMLGRLPGCGAQPSCLAQTRTNAATLRRPGEVKILSTTSNTAYALNAATGLTRVAWNVPGRLPVVQCVRVRRSGDVLSGLSVSLLSISVPISNTGSC